MDSEQVARDVMGWVGSKPVTGKHPWDIGVMPETAHQDETGRPVGYDPEVAFFSRHDDDRLLVFGPEDDRGRRGPGFLFDPFSDAESAQMVLQRLGKGHLLFDALAAALQSPMDRTAT